MEALKRFENKIKKTRNCWNWTGAKSKGRTAFYGTFYLNRPQKAHRAAYMLLVGPIADGMTVDHTCENTLCVNPKHLRCVSMLENCRASSRAMGFLKKKYCIHGHRYTEENTYRRSYKGRIHRQCNTCSMLRSNTHKQPFPKLSGPVFYQSDDNGAPITNPSQE